MSVCRSLIFKRFKGVLLVDNLPRVFFNQLTRTEKLSRDYSILNLNFNVSKGNRTNKFYHKSNIADDSFQITPVSVVETELDAVQFEKISDDTLDSLAEYFDELVEKSVHLPEADVVNGDGVLTIKFGNSAGTYVINRQTPNKQIWLSSPKSGPKRYDFINGTWIYKHDGMSLHQLLDNEISLVINDKTAFVQKCAYSSKSKK